LLSTLCSWDFGASFMAVDENDPKNRRGSDRIDAKIEVQFRSNKEFVSCYSQNISKGGIYIETFELPDPNANVELVLDLSAATSDSNLGKVSLVGKVVRLMTMSIDGRKVHKVALQFIDVPPQIQAKLDSLYEKLGGA